MGGKEFEASQEHSSPRYKVSERSFWIKPPTEQELSPLQEKLEQADIDPQFFPFAQLGIKGITVALHAFTEGDEETLATLHTNDLFAHPTDAFINSAYDIMPSLSRAIGLTAQTKQLFQQADLLIAVSRVATKVQRISPWPNMVTYKNASRITYTLPLSDLDPDDYGTISVMPLQAIKLRYGLSDEDPFELQFAFPSATSNYRSLFANVARYNLGDRLEATFDMGVVEGAEGFGQSENPLYNLRGVIKDANTIVNKYA